MPTDDPKSELRRRVAQSVETARLMGVENVPVFRGAPASGAPTGSPAAECEIEAKPAEAKPETQPVSEPETVEHPSQSGSDDDRSDAGVAAASAALDEIRARYEADAPHKDFNTEFNNIVFGEGHPRARLMFIGEAPGADEDRTGRPFVGRAGQLLDKMIVAMGLSRESVYIANVLKTRPPNNATPTPDEARACAPYLFEQVRVVRPRVIVTLGLPAARVILESNESMGRLRATWARLELPDSERYPGVGVDVMPTYHPAYLLRAYTPDNRAKVWSDLQQAMTRLSDG